MPLLRGLVTGVFAITLAAMSCISATQIVFEDSDPKLASRLPLRTGFAQSQEAQSLVEQSVVQGSPMEVRGPKSRIQRVRALALHAYALEPLDSVALSDLALVAGANGDIEAASKLMRDAEALTRRNLITNVWLMSDYTKRGNVRSALAALDNALRSSDEARQPLIRALVESLTHRELIGPVAQLLGAKPPWTDDFWHESYRVPAALPNVALLRITSQQRGLTVREEYDRGLLTELTRNGFYAEAENVLGAISSERRIDGEMLRNASFNSVPRYTPFDWQLFFGESLTADLAASAGQLVIHSYDGGNGKVARQLVHLAPGNYTISTNPIVSDPQSGDALSASVSCADETATPTREVFRHRASAMPQKFSIPAGGCSYFWFELDFAPQKDRQSTIVLDSVSLKTVGGDG